jgi:hypothetical protein
LQAKKLGDQMLELKMNSEKMWRGLISQGVPAVNAILKAFIDARKEGNSGTPPAGAFRDLRTRFVGESPRTISSA